MQINITNGTLTQVQETLSPASGYTLPSSISVSGATSNYNSSTGNVTLTNITSSVGITAIGNLIVYPSFSDVKLIDNTDYITLTINGVDFNLKTISETYLTLSNGDNLQDSGGNNLITTEV